MRRFLFILISSLGLCAEVFAIGETPQQLVGSLDEPLKGIKKNLVDSVKSSLSSRYVEDYRTYGSKVAYDSLVYRVNLVKAANEHNTSDTLASTRNVAQPLSEIDRLKKENQTLRNELFMLKTGETPAPELTQLQKRTRWIVKQLVIQNNAAADTLWKKYNDKSFGRGPFCFDSITVRSLKPFMPEYQKPRYLMARTYPVKKTRFEELYQQNEVRNLMREKVNYSLVGRNPAAFDFVRLGEYDNEEAFVDAKLSNVRKLDVDDNANLSVKDVKKPKANDAPVATGPWKTDSEVEFQFTQCYVSPNWYKGGDDYTTLVAEGFVTRDYLEDKKIWDNKLESKIGFYTSSALKDHAIRVYNDEFKLSSTMGYNLFDSKLYPALYGEFKTQFFRSYKNYKAKETEKTCVTSSFMSPTRVMLGVGPKYEYTKKIFAYLSPATAKVLFVVNDDIEDVRTVGIEDTTKKAQINFGIFGKGYVSWQFSKDISATSEFDIFAPYNFKNVEFNWKTNCVFKINNYLRTKLALNMRFDSTPMYQDNENPKLQILEQLGIGFVLKLNKQPK